MSHEEKMTWQEYVTGKTFSGLPTGEEHFFTVEQEIIPIVFVPGIMGSRLVSAKTGKKVWDPDSLVWMFMKYGLSGAAAKKKRLLGTTFSEGFLTVMKDGKSDIVKEDPDLKDRGWEGVVSLIYGEFLKQVHRGEFLRAPIGKETSSAKPDAPPKGWHFAVEACFSLPIFAYGYNWTGSAAESGRKLCAYIADIIQRCKKEGPCERVILISHSMGGLVTRSAIQQGASSNVLAAIHSVQPVHGAGSAVWRMKAGFERDGFMSTISSLVLGKNGAHVTALLANMPGGLQLLPTQNYTGDQGARDWLEVVDGCGKPLDKQPATGNPYEDIYREREKFWRLVEPEWLKDDEAEELGCDTWAAYLENLKIAEVFHQQLQLSVQPKRFVICGVGQKTAHVIRYQLLRHDWVNALWREALSWGLETLANEVSNYLNGLGVPDSLKATTGKLIGFGFSRASSLLGLENVLRSDGFHLPIGQNPLSSKDLTDAAKVMSEPLVTEALNKWFGSPSWSEAAASLAAPGVAFGLEKGLKALDLYKAPPATTPGAPSETPATASIAKTAAASLIARLATDSLKDDVPFPLQSLASRTLSFALDSAIATLGVPPSAREVVDFLAIVADPGASLLAKAGKLALKFATQWMDGGHFETEITDSEGQKFQVKLLPPFGDGDGTVPTPSGKGLPTEALEMKGFAHDEAFKIFKAGGPVQQTMTWVHEACVQRILDAGGRVSGGGAAP